MVLGSRYVTSFENQVTRHKSEGGFTFNIVGDTFTGIATAQGLSDMKIEEGKIDGNKITFVMVATVPAGRSNIEATIEGDKMFGTMDLGMGLPITPFEGTKVG